jgi:hypothetical protein
MTMEEAFQFKNAYICYKPYFFNDFLINDFYRFETIETFEIIVQISHQ